MASTCAVLGGSKTAPIVVGLGVFVVGALAGRLTTGIIAGGAAAAITYFACK